MGGRAARGGERVAEGAEYGAGGCPGRHPGGARLTAIYNDLMMPDNPTNMLLHMRRKRSGVLRVVYVSIICASMLCISTMLRAYAQCVCVLPVARNVLYQCACNVSRARAMRICCMCVVYVACCVRGPDATRASLQRRQYAAARCVRRRGDYISVYIRLLRYEPDICARARALRDDDGRRP